MITMRSHTRPNLRRAPIPGKIYLRLRRLGTTLLAGMILTIMIGGAAVASPAFANPINLINQSQSPSPEWVAAMA